MAITLEDVERLREKADVSYEEAKAALERSGGDLLDALIDLERQGRTRTPGGGGTYSTRSGAASHGEHHDRKERRDLPPSPDGGSGRLWDRLKELLHTLIHAVDPSTHNRFELWRQGRMVTSMPLLILIIAVVCVFWITVPLLLAGLLVGYRYRFSGPDLGRKDLNDAMDRMSRTVDGVKEQVRRSARGK